MELRHNNFKAALELMRRATAVPQRPKKLSQDEERKLPVQERLYRSVADCMIKGNGQQHAKDSRVVYMCCLQTSLAARFCWLHTCIYRQQLQQRTAGPALAGSPRSYHAGADSPMWWHAVARLCVACRSSKLWSFYADLEESLGTLESACGVYDKMLELKVATPQIILNYALMLQVRGL